MNAKDYAAAKEMIDNDKTLDKYQCFRLHFHGLRLFKKFPGWDPSQDQDVLTIMNLLYEAMNSDEKKKVAALIKKHEVANATDSDEIEAVCADKD